jgi:hypothetical protein
MLPNGVGLRASGIVTRTTGTLLSYFRILMSGCFSLPHVGGLCAPSKPTNPTVGASRPKHPRHFALWRQLRVTIAILRIRRSTRSASRQQLLMEVEPCGLRRLVSSGRHSMDFENPFLFQCETPQTWMPSYWRHNSHMVLTYATHCGDVLVTLDQSRHRVELIKRHGKQKSRVVACSRLIVVSDGSPVCR